MTYDCSDHSLTQIVVLDRGDYTSCTVNLHGATVTSWRILNKEMLFVSRRAHYSGLSFIRGGVQCVFPVMGHWGFGQRHGFARYMPWYLITPPVKTDAGDVYIEIGLSDNPYTRALWNYKFKLYYKITLYETKLTFRIGVENYSQESPIHFKIMQHSLFKVPDVTKCVVIGLKNCKYKDGMNNHHIRREKRDKVVISEQVDRTYIDAPNQVELHNAVNGGTLRITKMNAYDVNLWNPWLEQSLAMTDIGPDEYQNFIAIEAGMASKAVCLEPLTCWRAREILEYIELHDEKPEDDYEDVFENYC